MKCKHAAALCFSLAFTLSSAHATPLLVNGGFETGTFSGWNVANLTGSTTNSSFFIAGSTVSPQSASPTAGPASGRFYAVSDAPFGPGTHALAQTFVVPANAVSVLLSFSLFANNFLPPPVINPIGLDHRGINPNQHARVDLLTGGASTFDTGVGVLRNFYLGADRGTGANPYTGYLFDITSNVVAGGTYSLRFAETDNQGIFNLGVDNVSIEASQAQAIPEPGTMAVTGLFACLLLLARRAR